MREISSEKRRSGIPLIGDLPWGTSICQFYQTKDDLLDILLPYLKAGLEENEFCVWVTCGPLKPADAKKVLKRAVPHLEKLLEKGQLEVIGQRQWNAEGGKSGIQVFSRLNRAITSGFDGLRLACGIPEKPGHDVFNPYGIHHSSGDNVIAVFACHRDRFDATGLMEVVKHHRFALVSNGGSWEVIESSEARVVKDALKRTEEKLQSLFSNMSEGFAYHRIVLDGQGRPCDYIFLEVNDSFERLTGLKGKEIIGRAATEVLPGLDKDSTDWIERYGKVALSGDPVHFERYSETLDRWFAVSAFSPRKGYFAVTFSDITERKRAEEDLRKAHQVLREHAARLEAANKELESFSYSVSHDLRSPLRAIGGFTRMILEEQGASFDPETRRKFGIIQENAVKMGRLIDDILRLSRLNRVELRRSTIDMAELLAEILEEIRATEPERRFKVEIGHLPPLHGDPTLIRQLMMNLLSNAVKFTRLREKPLIQVGSMTNPDGLVYFVKDNGVGFDMAYYGKLFGVFQRLVSEKQFEGTGVGLAIAQRIIQRHGGRIWAEGKPQEGAAFYFSLPRTSS